MIRINLLPQAKAKAKGAPSPGSGQGWLVAYFAAVLVSCALLAGVYFVYSARLEERQRRNADLQAQITQARTLSANLDEVQGKLKRSQDLERVVGELQKARLGPTRVLMELSRILSINGGPTIDPQRLEQLKRDNPLAGYNPGWDGRRIWVTSFKEEERACTILGVGKTNEDVAEFLRRLALSDLFEEVTLEKTQAQTDADTQLPMIGFELTAKVRY